MAARRGIATMYKGIQYRSRLEARWASFFTKIGWSFVYEPFDGDGYIPDFLIEGDSPLLIEVKPAVSDAEYHDPIAKLENGLRRHWEHDVLIVGTTPLPMSVVSSEWCGWNTAAAGILGEYYADEDWSWGAALWGQCTQCRRIGVWHAVQSFTLRPTGCYDGGSGFQAPPVENRVWPVEKCTGRPVDSIGSLRMAWSDACNDAKWHGRDA